MPQVIADQEFDRNRNNIIDDFRGELEDKNKIAAKNTLDILKELYQMDIDGLEAELETI